MLATEGEVTNLFWNQDLTQVRPIVSKNLHAISRARKDVTMHVYPKSIGKSGIYNCENSTIFHSPPIHHIKCHDVMIPVRIERRRSVCDVEDALIRRKR